MKIVNEIEKYAKCTALLSIYAIESVCVCVCVRALTPP